MTLSTPVRYTEEHSVDSSGTVTFPREMWVDESKTTAGEIANLSRRYERALRQQDQATVPLPWSKRMVSYLGAAVVGVLPGVALYAGMEKFCPNISREAKELVFHATTTAGLITAIHAADHILMKQPEHTIDEATQGQINAARSHARKLYTETLEAERQQMESAVASR